MNAVLNLKTTVSAQIWSVVRDAIVKGIDLASLVNANWTKHSSVDTSADFMVDDVDEDLRRAASGRCK